MSASERASERPTMSRGGNAYLDTDLEALWNLAEDVADQWDGVDAQGVAQESILQLLDIPEFVRNPPAMTHTIAWRLSNRETKPKRFASETSVATPPAVVSSEDIEAARTFALAIRLSCDTHIIDAKERIAFQVFLQHEAVASETIRELKRVTGRSDSTVRRWLEHAIENLRNGFEED